MEEWSEARQEGAEPGLVEEDVWGKSEGSEGFSFIFS